MYNGTLACRQNSPRYIIKPHLEHYWMSHDTERSPSSITSSKLDIQIYHYIDVIMSAIASQITSLTIVHSTVYSVTDQRKHQSFASLAFARGIHRWPVNSPHKGPVTRKCFHLMTHHTIMSREFILPNNSSFGPQHYLEDSVIPTYALIYMYTPWTVGVAYIEM